MMNPELKVGLDTGDLRKFTTFPQFMDGIKQQIEHMLDLTCSIVKKNRDASTFFARPFKSLLTEGCIESGLDFNNGGAVYDYYQIAFGAVPNLADSLMVVKKFVYDDKKYTLEELKEILQQDYPDESIRQEFINKAPKFGNDIDEVDQLAVEILNFGCDVLKKMSVKYGLPFHAQPFTFFYMIDYGNVSAATPDGRRKGETFAYSMSPMQGRDFNGLTAVFNSLSKLPGKRTPGTTSAIVEIDPKLFTDQNIGVLTDIFIASAKKGLCNVQFNNIDVDTLLDAKKHPEKYNNLAVRVSGFSQKFNLLKPAVQDHIIARTKHKCL